MKSYLYTALWLMWIVWTLSIWVVNADDTTQWVEWEDFEALNVKASDWETVLFTIMDRNLGATEPWTWVDSYGYFYQWWNNYGFSSEAWTYPANSGTELVDITWEWYGPWKYYSSDKFIMRTSNPRRWDTDESNETYAQYWNLNLWWWEHVYNSDVDRQWPCPSWYHVPDIFEWHAAKDLWCKQKMNNVGCFNWNIFRDDLLLPAAGLRDSSSAGVNYQNHTNPYNYGGYYWSSSPANTSNSASFAFRFEESYFAPISQWSLSRTYGYSVRCFKNSQDTKTLTLNANNGEENVVYNIRWWEPISNNYEFLPERDWYRFLGWYEWDTKFNFSDTTYITGNTVLEAKWEKFPWYTYDANGGVFADQSTQNIIKYSKTVESTELSFGSRGFKTIEWATKMHADVILIEFISADPEGEPIIYVYNYAKNDATIGDDYIMSGTQESLSGNIEVTWDTIWFVVTDYVPFNRRIFNIIGESDYTTSWVVTQPTREWYTFSGWYVIEDNQEVDFDPEADNEIEDKTIYARWESNGQADKYTISFDTDGWNQIDSIEVEYGSAIDANTLPVPVKDCNEFLWWEGLVETMPANNITLKAKWNYTCSNNKSSWSSWGGWRWKSSKNSDSKTENTSSDKVIDSQNENSETHGAAMEENDGSYSEESVNAYQFAYKNWITTMDSIEKADLELPLTRIAMAKMLSQYAINILGKKPANIVVPDFKDITPELDEEYNYWVTLAYQLWIMGINMPDNEFRPFDEVTRWEFTTALSRMIYWIADWSDLFYSTHMEKLKGEWVITIDDPYLIELRGSVMIMLMRTAKV